MRRIAFTSAVILFALSAAIAQAQESQPASPATVATASYTQAYCTGFIAPTISPDLFILGGGDDDFHSVVRQFVQDESVFIAQRGGPGITPGAEYSVIRPAKELFETMRYQGEAGEIGKLGRPYEDVAQVKVTHINPDGVVAKVTFSCEAIVPGDILVPFQPRVIPDSAMSTGLDHFAPLDKSKSHGRIAASRGNFGFFGNQTVVYLTLGEKEGAQPGKRFRIYKVLPRVSTGLLSSKATPPETIGEAVVMSVQARSCVAMVVSSAREVSSGDYVEEE